MLWIFLAISSHFLWAVENVVSKHIVSKRISNPYVFLVILTMAGGTVMIVAPFINFFVPSVWFLFLLAGTGFLYFYAGLPYIKAMQIEEVTRINILWNLMPIFSFFLGYLIGDSLSLLEITAVLFLVSGGVMASIRHKNGKLSFSKAFWLMMLSAFCYSVYGVVFRHITRTIPFSTAFVWVIFFEVLAAASALFISRIRSDFKQAIKNAGRSLWWMILGLAIIANLGIFLNQWAISLRATALVFSFEGFQAIFVFLMAVLITRYDPNVLKEELDRKNILLKLTAVILMAAGAGLLGLK